MGFTFNPVLHFLCKSCQETFPSSDELIEHKVRNHLGDCLKTKAIVFEEKILYRNQDELDTGIGLASQESTTTVCTNPCVSLERLTSSPRGSKSCRKRGPKSVQKNTKASLKLTKSSLLDSPSSVTSRSTNSASILAMAIPGLDDEGRDPESILGTFDSSFAPDFTEAEEHQLTSTTSPGPASMEEIEFKFVPPVNFDIPTPAALHFETNPSNSTDTGQIISKVEFTDYDLLPNPTAMVRIEIENENESSTEFPPIITDARSLQEFPEMHFEAEKPPKLYQCEFCPSSFTTKTYLKGHLLTHTTNRPFKCGYCSSSFKTKLALENHLVLHGRVTKYKCDFCDKCCISSKMLREHIRTHTGERPYKCQVLSCAKGFPSQSALTVHLRLKHATELGLEQFSCEVCDKRFGLMTCLNRHMITHSKDKPFKCTYDGCHVTFKRKENLKNHIRSCNHGN